MSTNSVESIESKITSAIERGLRLIKESRQRSTIILVKLDRTIKESEEIYRKVLEEIRENIGLLIKEHEETKKNLLLTKNVLKEKIREIEKLEREIEILKRKLSRGTGSAGVERLVEAKSVLIAELPFSERRTGSTSDKVEVELSWMN